MLLCSVCGPRVDPCRGVHSTWPSGAEADGCNCREQPGELGEVVRLYQGGFSDTSGTSAANSRDFSFTCVSWTLRRIRKFAVPWVAHSRREAQFDTRQVFRGTWGGLTQKLLLVSLRICISFCLSIYISISICIYICLSVHLYMCIFLC